MVDFHTNIELIGKFKAEEIQLMTVPKDQLCMFFEFFDPDHKNYPIMITCDDAHVFVVIPRPEPSETE